jgi:serine/threonine protein kinase
MKKTCNLKAVLEYVDPSTWTDPETCKAPEEVNLTTIYPPYLPHYKRLVLREGESEAGLDMKKIRYLDKTCRQKLGSCTLTRIGDVVAREVGICERLRVGPHPKIVEYLGVFSRDNVPYIIGNTNIEVPLDVERVLGIWYARYDCTLHDLVIRDETFDVRHCLESIDKGIEHMHGLGIVHCDIKPQNIFVKRLFRLRLKIGTNHWWRDKTGSENRAYKSDGWYSFQKVKEALVKYRGGMEAMYDGIGKMVAKN